MIAEPIQITWLNQLGGFEYFLFTAFKDFNIEIGTTTQVRQNTFIEWPKSYGANADTIDKQTYRTSKRSIIVKSQLLSKNQLIALSYIKTSPLVQIMVSRNNKITVLVDSDSFKQYSEQDKIFLITFKATLTDEIPSQSL